MPRWEASAAWTSPLQPPPHPTTLSHPEAPPQRQEEQLVRLHRHQPFAVATTPLQPPLIRHQPFPVATTPLQPTLIWERGVHSSSSRGECQTVWITLMLSTTGYRIHNQKVRRQLAPGNERRSAQVGRDSMTGTTSLCL